MVRYGDVDVVHGKKWPIDFNEIAAGIPDIGLEQVVLVEGAPGVGKSTFAWEYCRRWERGEISQQYQLVLLLRLRDERMSKAKTLRDLIMHDSEDVRQAVTADLGQSHGSKTLILLEGFDELPDTCRTPQSIFLRLICGELLPLATVMVTSRPWATGMFLEHYKHRLLQHIEIMGFTTQQISEYIKSALPENEAKNLESYVNNRLQIRGCMYIPLNSAIVVTVYQDRQASGCPLPTTLTELYTDLAQILLVRYLHGHPELEKGSDKHRIRIFKDLNVPHGVKRYFTELCELAYRGIVGESEGTFEDLSLLQRHCKGKAGTADIQRVGATSRL
ncbi:Protein NLRC3 [Geodia barretti]|uniref:Protein NLRC3 n=1 Tax=Geodia barretti TaxID=519541 RepID=A0AA35WXG1_GEOBA|nr:Protein NLRC3 [Geodia barretti]